MPGAAKAISMTDDDQAKTRRFLEIFFAGTQYPFELRAIRKPDPVVPAFFSNAQEAAFFIKRNRRKNIYFGVCTRQGGGEAQHVREIPGFWIDIDFKDTPEEEARRRVAEFPLPPTFTVRSGGGLHLYWLFKEPAPAGELAPTPYLKGLAAALGGDSASTDLARIMRLPYTWNIKYDPPVQCRVEEFKPELRYNPSDFEIYRQEEDAADAPAPQEGGVPADVLLEKCAFLRHCRDDAATLPEPHWWAMVSNLCREPGGRDLIHRLSAPYPKYSRKETDEKILNAANKSGPLTCEKIRELFECGPCPVKAPLAWLRQKADPPPVEVSIPIAVYEPKGKDIAAGPISSIFPERGFVRAYIDCFSKVTDAPDIYHLFMGYFTLAALLRDRLYMRLAGDRLFTNLWLVLIGGSSLFRKTTSLNKSRSIISRHAPGLVLPSDFTTEALLDILSATPQGAFYHPEFRSMYGMLAKDYMSGAKALLTELYDSPEEYRRETKGRTVNIRQPVISMASATTTEWLTSKNSEEDFGSGFLARFLFVPAFVRERSLAFPPEIDTGEFRHLMDSLRQIESAFGLGAPREARYAPAAREYYEKWHGAYDQIDPFGGTPLAPFHARYQAYAHKLAMLYTASVCGSVSEIDGEAMFYATETVNFVTKQLATLYEKFLTFNREDEMAKRLLNLLPEKEAMTRSDLLRRARMSARTFENIVRTLMESGQIEEKIAMHRGQRTRVYVRKS